MTVLKVTRLTLLVFTGLVGGCIPHRGFSEWEALTPADVALDSVPIGPNKACGQPVSVGDDGEYPGFRMSAEATRDSTGGFLWIAVLARVPQSFRQQRADVR